METKLEQIAAKAVKQRPKSVVREICTLRSVGTGGGRPPPVTRWALSNGRPYREQPARCRLDRGAGTRAEVRLCSARIAVRKRLPIVSRQLSKPEKLRE